MTIVFLHGLGQAAASWDNTIALLPRDGDYRCPELPALLSGKEATYHNLYTGLEAYCQAIPGQLTLCGLSLGGVLALDYAQRHPERIHSLILIAAQYQMPRALLALQNLIFRFMPEEKFQGLGFGKQDFITLCATTGKQNLSKGLCRLPCPTLVLCGETDQPNRKASRGLAKQIPHSQFFLIPDSGHTVNTDNPQALAQAIVSFLEKEWQDETGC